MPAIAIRHLSKTFEQKGNSVEAMRDISLDIEETSTESLECPVPGKVPWCGV